MYFGKGQVDHYDQALKGYLDYETTEVKKLLKAILETWKDKQERMIVNKYDI